MYGHKKIMYGSKTMLLLHTELLIPPQETQGALLKLLLLPMVRSASCVYFSSDVLSYI